MDAFGVFRLLLDEHSSQILQLTEEKPLNATELSDALRIPIAACYRRIRALKEAGMLKEDGRAVSIGGKLVATYRSSVGKAEVMLQDGRLRVIIQAAGEDVQDEMVLNNEPPTMLHWVPGKSSPKKNEESL